MSGAVRYTKQERNKQNNQQIGSFVFSLSVSLSLSLFL
jgi:hypothetical protein